MKVKEAAGRKSIQWLTIPLVPIVIVGGFFYPMLGWVVVGMIAFFMVLTFFKGRYFCGWFCALGSFFERIISKISLKKPMLPLFKKKWFRWMLFGLMMSLLASRLYMSEGNIEKIGATFHMMWIISLGFAVFFGFLYKPRTWCAVCPMGTMQGLLSKNINLLQVSADCKQCGLCQKACPVSTNPGMYKEAGSVPSIDCMRCSNCVENCPQQALSFPQKMSNFTIPESSAHLGKKVAAGN